MPKFFNEEPFARLRFIERHVPGEKATMPSRVLRILQQRWRVYEGDTDDPLDHSIRLEWRDVPLEFDPPTM